MGSFYPQGYFSGYCSRSAKITFKKRLDLIKNFKRSGMVLDFGCSSGGFLKFLSEHGFDVKGVDASDSAIELARRSGCDFCSNADLKAVSFPDRSFDVICLFETLEHLFEPDKILAEFRRIIKDDGVLVISVPNFGSIERHVLGRFWTGIDVPRHLFHFDKITLKDMVEAAGFKIKLLKDVASPEINDVGSNSSYSNGVRVMLRSLGLYRKQAHGRKAAIPDRLNILKKLLRAIESVFFYPFFIFAKITSRQATLVLVAEKA